MIYILIGFALDILIVVGSIYLKDSKANLDNLIILSKKSGKNPYLIIASGFIKMLFVWPYVVFIYKPKDDMEASDE
jgi:hypothetical protein